MVWGDVVRCGGCGRKQREDQKLSYWSYYLLTKEEQTNHCISPWSSLMTSTKSSGCRDELHVRETRQTISTLNSWGEFCCWGETKERQDGKGHRVTRSLNFYFRSWNGRKMTAHLYADGEDPVKGRTDGVGKKNELQRNKWGWGTSHREREDWV